MPESPAAMRDRFDPRLTLRAIQRIEHILGTKFCNVDFSAIERVLAEEVAIPTRQAAQPSSEKIDAVARRIAEKVVDMAQYPDGRVCSNRKLYAEVAGVLREELGGGER